MTLILILHNIVFELYLYSKFGEKIFIGYKDMSQNVGRKKKKTEKKNPSVKRYVAQSVLIYSIWVPYEIPGVTFHTKSLKTT